MSIQLSEVMIQNILAEHADGLLNQSGNLATILNRHNLSLDSPLARLMSLAEYLYHALPHVKPSDEFVESLYRQLIEADERTLRDWLRFWRPDLATLERIWQHQIERLSTNLPQRQIDRIRQIPLHMQLAAGITITAGVLLITSRKRRDALQSLIDTVIAERFRMAETSVDPIQSATA